jgi:hypothetical protein
MTKLTELQVQALNAVCRTNGGGISLYSDWRPQLVALHKKGLVQGKSGNQSRAVHTAEGLKLWRELSSAKEPAR